ncbi:uncharacterized protein EAF02_009850 [Botrytis sinoallii]|uniref:uncharacterized protein n=1 Tax=Botrytis sinoallii TaxID=1463999 RepID=UPI001901A93B|nr:uncharacterized protein EAF02_009850 [Botrytis sinoallii]KAF7867064.1 hypothetical protein EAF02_009850 [Botrytis sinoallii]
MHAYQPRDFARVPISQGCEGCTQITTEAIPDDAIPPPLPGDSINSPHITMAEFPLTPIQMATPQAPEDSTEITQEEFTHCAIKLPSSQPIGGSSKFKEKPPHFAIQVSSPAGFGRDLDFMKN